MTELLAVVSVLIVIGITHGHDPFGIESCRRDGVFSLLGALRCVLWLMRLAPRYREIPVWIDRRNSVIDYTFWAAIGFTLLAALVS
jgi:hypothetical protein